MQRFEPSSKLGVGQIASRCRIASVLSVKTFFIMTLNGSARCYTKFDWLKKSVHPIKFHVISIFRILGHSEKGLWIFIVCKDFIIPDVMVCKSASEHELVSTSILTHRSSISSCEKRNSDHQGLSICTLC